MDAAEAVAKDLQASTQLQVEFFENLELIKKIFEFMKSDERQHEEEEERVRLPVLKTQMDNSRFPLQPISVQKVSKEHRHGRKLVSELESETRGVEKTKPKDLARYTDFSGKLLELVWHFRRHVWAENSGILAATERLIPDHCDELWSDSTSKPEVLDV
jgi:hemerythrin-like domain-containing protein